MRYQAETCKLVKGKDTIQFVLNEETAYITYYYVYNDFTEELTCSVNDANDRFENAIKAGYKKK